MAGAQPLPCHAVIQRRFNFHVKWVVLSGNEAGWQAIESSRQRRPRSMPRQIHLQSRSVKCRVCDDNRDHCVQLSKAVASAWDSSRLLRRLPTASTLWSQQKQPAPGCRHRQELSVVDQRRAGVTDTPAPRLRIIVGGGKVRPGASRYWIPIPP